MASPESLQKRLKHTPDLFGFAKHHIHTLGHANTLDLKSIANTINPKGLSEE